jgi:cell division protein FtsL
MSANEASAVKKLTTVDSVVNWQLPLLAVLFVGVIFVAIKTVVHRHESRNLFMQLQVLEKERDKLSAQWSRLKLEQGTMLNQVRVERNARWDLGMRMPKASEVRMIREPVKKSFLVVEAVAQSKTSKVASTD